MIRNTLIAATLALVSASALASVSAEEAAQLGKSLTPIGAEKAGNADGTIPAWTGAEPKIPAGATEWVRPDPYAGEKPRLVITGKVVGKGKGMGYGSRLIQECLDDARAQRMKGVAMLTSDRTWLAGKDIFERNGFKEVDSAPPSFQLMAARFGSDPSTATSTSSARRLRTKPEADLPKNWDERARAFGPGLTVIRTAQYPYIENATNAILDFAKERKIEAKDVEFKTAQEVQERSPSAYGVFGTVLDGRLLAYHYLLPKDFDKLMLEHKKGV